MRCVLRQTDGRAEIPQQASAKLCLCSAGPVGTDRGTVVRGQGTKRFVRNRMRTPHPCIPLGGRSKPPFQVQVLYPHTEFSHPARYRRHQTVSMTADSRNGLNSRIFIAIL